MGKESTKNMNKPVCKLFVNNGNIFNLIGVASNALKKAGQAEKAYEMQRKVMTCDTYMDALAVLDKYVDIE